MITAKTEKDYGITAQILRVAISGLAGGISGTLLLVGSTFFINSQEFSSFHYSIRSIHFGPLYWLGFILLAGLLSFVVDLKFWKGFGRASSSSVALMLYAGSLLIFLSHFEPVYDKAVRGDAATRVILFGFPLTWGVANLTAKWMAQQSRRF